MSDNWHTAKREDPAYRPLVTFSFRNLGPVNRADLELGELTIIAGRNNTGKSHLVCALYGFLKAWSNWQDTAEFLAGENRTRAGFPDFASIARDLLREGRVTVDVEPVALKNQVQQILDQFGRDFSKSAIAEVFNAGSDDFDGARIAARLRDDETTGVGLASVEIKHAGAGIANIRHDGDRIIITMDGSSRQACRTAELAEVTARAYGRLLLGGIFPEPFVLPAERFGISLFHRELDFARHQIVDALQKMGGQKSWDRISPFDFIDRHTSRHALPTKDNIDWTRSLPDRKNDQGELWSIKTFDDIKNMMGRHFGVSGDEIRFISKARGQGRSFNLPLHLASSSARGLSGLHFFLKHVASRNHLLIVEEPESHLDTANQIELARLLARLVRAGLKVLVTTHSDYLIKEINNLVMLNSEFSEKAALRKRLGYGREDAIDPDSIRAYVAMNNGLSRCDIDRFGIDAPVFDETIDSINTAANELASCIEQ